MEDNKELVTEEVTENTEQETAEENVTDEKVDNAESKEESVKTYSEEDFEKEVNSRVDELLSKKINRNNRKIRREYEEKYGKLENVLRAGTGEQDLEAITNQLENFYKGEGISIPPMNNYSNDDLETLGSKDADDIISSGYDDIKEEVDRLANIGLDKMTAREKATFQKLAKVRKGMEAEKELAKIGVGKEVLEDDNFKAFTKKLNPELSIKDMYEMYTQVKPKPEVKKMGSMKSTTKQPAVKDFYTREEALKFTRADFDKNPELFKAVEKSMQKW